MKYYDTVTTRIGIAIVILGIAGVALFNIMPDHTADIVSVLGILIPSLLGLLGYYTNKTR